MTKKLDLTDVDAELFKRAIGFTIDYAADKDYKLKDSDRFDDQEHKDLCNAFWRIWPQERREGTPGKAISVYDLTEKIKQSVGACADGKDGEKQCQP